MKLFFKLTLLLSLVSLFSPSAVFAAAEDEGKPPRRKLRRNSLEISPAESELSRLIRSCDKMTLSEKEKKGLIGVAQKALKEQRERLEGRGLLLERTDVVKKKVLLCVHDELKK